MYKKIFSLIFIYLFIFSVNAEIVKEIKITGNKRISQETIIVYGDVKIDQNLSESNLNNILKSLYSTNFFEDIKINLENNVLTINVKEYPVVNQLIILGEPSKRIREKFKELISIKENKAFIQPNLYKDIALIKNFILQQVLITVKWKLKLKILMRVD